jgi:hypothetical protein
MQTKLTLRLDADLIEQAKQYAEKVGKSVSQMVADYFSFLSKNSEAQKVHEEKLSPAVRSLFGVLKGKAVNKDTYRRYLEDKHR